MPMTENELRKAILRSLDKTSPPLPLKFHVGEYVELLKDFPTVGLTKGSRFFITGRIAGRAPGKHCPKGLCENYQINGSNFGIKVKHLKAVI